MRWILVESGMSVNEIEHRVSPEPRLTPNDRPLHGASSKLPLLAPFKPPLLYAESQVTEPLSLQAAHSSGSIYSSGSLGMTSARTSAQTSSRPPDHQRENTALTALVHRFSRRSAHNSAKHWPIKSLRCWALIRAGGCKSLTKDGKRFYWVAIAGAWRPHIGGGTPRDFGPTAATSSTATRRCCSLIWERRYPYLNNAMPLAEDRLASFT